MAHPEMFERDDPLLALVRSIALDLPGTSEKISHGRPAFFTRKVLTYYSGSVRPGAGDWVQHPRSVVVMLDSDERAALLEDAHTYVPAYLGPSGWLGVDLSPESDFEEIAELIESSYRNTAPARLLAELDDRR